MESQRHPVHPRAGHAVRRERVERAPLEGSASGRARAIASLVAFVASLIWATHADAQGPVWAGALTLDTEAVDRWRVDQVLGGAETSGFLLRSPSSVMDRVWGGTTTSSVRLLSPELRVVWNSDLPFSANDGPLWAGRGASVLVTLGGRVAVRLHEHAELRVVVAPQLLYQQNEPFQVIPYASTAEPPRDLFANPLHPPPESLDAPLRFGSEPFGEAVWGQSSVYLHVGPVAAGWGTENHWWGPGIRNALLLSSHAAGFPHWGLATSRPVATRLGAIEARWLVGRLEESEYFDEEPENDYRTLSAVAVTLNPSFDPDLTVGLARVVWATLQPDDAWWGAFPNAFRGVGQPNSEKLDEVPPEGMDQISSFFWRWVVPRARLETYGEWARFEEPRSFRDFLEFPNHSQAFTFGAHWAGGDPARAVVTVQAELTNLEPSATWRQRHVFASYTSRVVPQGYSHRGQVIGAAIGSGASSQWLAVDRRSARGWRLGLFGGRVRWENAVLFTDVVTGNKREDISLFWGLRGGVDVAGWSLSADFSQGVRLNYLFQSFAPDETTGAVEGVDIPNTRIAFILARTLSD